MCYKTIKKNALKGLQIRKKSTILKIRVEIINV